MAGSGWQRRRLAAAGRDGSWPWLVAVGGGGGGWQPSIGSGGFRAAEPRQLGLLYPPARDWG